MEDLTKAVVLVTGGAQGIGRSFVENLLAAGARVAIGDLKNSLGPKTRDELDEKYPGKVIFVACNVTDSSEFEEALKTTKQKFGPINILINNAGICNETDDGWATMVRINLDGVVIGTKLGIKHMGKEGGGNGGIVVNIASITSFSPWDPLPVYSGTKAFVNQFSSCYGRPVHYDYSGVKVISINPGLTDTAILQTAAQGIIKDSEKIVANFTEFLKTFPVQTLDNMGRGLVQILKKAENGSIWVIENNEPAKRVKLTVDDI